MPFGNKTGPAGQGPRTGRGLGYCSGYSSPGYTKSGFGRGFYGKGGGRGWKNWYRATGLFGWQRKVAPKEEKGMISDEIKVLENQIKEIEGRIKELKKST